MILLVQKRRHTRAVVRRVREELHHRARGKAHMLLSAAEKRRRRRLANCFRPRVQAEKTGAGRQAVTGFAARAQEIPAQGEFGRFKGVTGGRLRPAALRQIRRGKREFHVPRLRAEHGPSVLPDDRDGECLAAKIAVLSAVRTRAQHDGPPLSVLRLNKVRVSGAVDGAVKREVAVRDQRVAGISLVRAGQRPAPEHRDGVRVTRSALRDQQIIVFTDVVQMRPLRRARVVQRAVRAQDVPLAQQLARPEIQLLKPDVAALVLPVLRIRAHIAKIIRFAAVKKERGVDPFCALDHDGVRPRPRGILRRHEKVDVAPVKRSSHKRRDHIKEPVMAADRRGIDALRSAESRQVQLRRAVQTVADLMPVDKIPGMEHRDAREELKRRCDEIIVLSPAADRRVGIKAGQQRVVQFPHEKHSPFAIAQTARCLRICICFQYHHKGGGCQERFFCFDAEIGCGAAAPRVLKKFFTCRTGRGVLYWKH